MTSLPLQCVPSSFNGFELTGYLFVGCDVMLQTRDAARERKREKGEKISCIIFLAAWNHLCFGMCVCVCSFVCVCAIVRSCLEKPAKSRQLANARQLASLSWIRFSNELGAKTGCSFHDLSC